VRCGPHHAFVAAEVTRLKSQRRPKTGQSLLTSAATRSSRNARRELEKKSGRKVVTSGNYLALTQSVKKEKTIKQ